MSKGSSDCELGDLIRQLDAITGEAHEVFGKLGERQINWKPSAESWSVGQCFEHLIKTNEFYFPTLEQVAAGVRKGSVWERLSPLSGFFGRSIIKSMSPGGKGKFRAPKTVRPAASAVGADVIERFTESQRELAARMKATQNLDAKGIVVTSPVARLVTYSLADAYRIIVMHERRHFEQARRVTEAEGFPK